MYRWVLVSLLPTALTLGALPVHGAPAATGPAWRLPASDYPRHSKLDAGGADNAQAQRLFGAFHAHSYSALSRIDTRGWLQAAVLVKVTHKVRRKKTTSRRHVLYWRYLVSYYPSVGAASSAFGDIRAVAGPLPGGVDEGRILTRTAGGTYATLAWLRKGLVTVEQLCMVKRADKRHYGKELNRYCTVQRSALIAVAGTAVTEPSPGADTPTSSPIRSPPPTGAAAPTSTPTDAATPAATIAPATTTPSPAVLALSVSVSPNPMPYGAHPVLSAYTVPFASCTASVVYSTGRSPASFDGSPHTANASGTATWTWHEETQGAGGTASVSCTLGDRSAQARTSFVVGHQ